MVSNKNNINECRLFSDDEKTRSNLLIYNQLKKKNTTSINEIAKQTNIEENKIIEYVGKCEKAGLLKIGGPDNKKNIEFNDEHRKILGVSFHEGKCIITDIGLDGEIITHEEIDIKPVKKMKGTNKELKEIIDRIKHHTKLRGTGISHIGIAIPDSMNAKNPKTAEILSDGINRLFGCKIFIAKESTAAGYGEMDFGDNTQNTDILYVYMDVGIGTVIKGEQIFEASENIVDGDAYYLRAWEQFDVVKTSKSLIKKGLGTSMVNMISGDVEDMDIDVVLKAADAKDELAEDLVKRSALALGVRIAYIVNKFDIKTVIMGGGIEIKEGQFINYVKESSKRFLSEKLEKNIKIIPGILGVEAASIGAASMCRREMFMEV